MVNIFGSMQLKERMKDMNITQFDRFRINSESSIGSAVFMDVQKLDCNCSQGFMAVAYEIPSLNKGYAKHKIEVRRKDRTVALITYRYSDTEIDEYWRDAEVLYTWEQER